MDPDNKRVSYESRKKCFVYKQKGRHPVKLTGVHKCVHFFCPEYTYQSATKGIEPAAYKKFKATRKKLSARNSSKGKRVGIGTERELGKIAGWVNKYKHLQLGHFLKKQKLHPTIPTHIRRQVFHFAEKGNEYVKSCIRAFMKKKWTVQRVGVPVGKVIFSFFFFFGHASLN